MVSGLRTKEIAASLGVSVKTVETQRLHFMQRLGIVRLPALLRYALSVGILPLSWLLC